jgi:hypothetical protein
VLVVCPFIVLNVEVAHIRRNHFCRVLA